MKKPTDTAPLVQGGQGRDDMGEECFDHWPKAAPFVFLWALVALGAMLAQLLKH
jgi:hypothetical protein